MQMGNKKVFFLLRLILSPSGPFGRWHTLHACLLPCKIWRVNGRLNRFYVYVCMWFHLGLVYLLVFSILLMLKIDDSIRKSNNNNTNTITTDPVHFHYYYYMVRFQIQFSYVCFGHINVAHTQFHKAIRQRNVRWEIITIAGKRMNE